MLKTVVGSVGFTGSLGSIGVNSLLLFPFDYFECNFSQSRASYRRRFICIERSRSSLLMKKSVKGTRVTPSSKKTIGPKRISILVRLLQRRIVTNNFWRPPALPPPFSRTSLRQWPWTVATRPRRWRWAGRCSDLYSKGDSTKVVRCITYLFSVFSSHPSFHPRNGAQRKDSVRQAPTEGHGPWGTGGWPATR